MRKLISLSAVVLIAGGFALAAGRGAVKTGLYARQQGDGARVAGSGPKVGFVVLNTDPNGTLWANVVAKNLPEGTYDVYVKTFVVDPNGNPVATVNQVGTVQTNHKGKGEAMFNVSAGPAGAEGSVHVQVVVKPTGTSKIVGASTATVDVPVKP